MMPLCMIHLLLSYKMSLLQKKRGNYQPQVASTLQSLLESSSDDLVHAGLLAVSVPESGAWSPYSPLVCTLMMIQFKSVQQFA